MFEKRTLKGGLDLQAVLFFESLEWETQLKQWCTVWLYHFSLLRNRIILEFDMTSLEHSRFLASCKRCTQPSTRIMTVHFSPELFMWRLVRALHGRGQVPFAFPPALQILEYSLELIERVGKQIHSDFGHNAPPWKPVEWQSRHAGFVGICPVKNPYESNLWQACAKISHLY